MKYYYSLLIVFLFFIFSCNDDLAKEKPATDSNFNHLELDTVLNRTFTADWKMLTKDFDTWYNYSYYNVNLSEDFIPLDFDSATIGKYNFIHKLVTENVVALKIGILQGKTVYKLFKPLSRDEAIITTSKQSAATEMAHFEMEGKEIADFNFTDLNGKIYNKASTKGKILVLKCWFINCVACVKEFPELNKLVDSFTGKDDIVFISLAFDPKEDLEKFLKTKPFKYATVPAMKDYVISKLNITQFPTHLLIGKDGKIKKVVNKIENILPFIKAESEKK